MLLLLLRQNSDGGKAGEEEEGEVSGANRKTREQMERTARTQYGKSERMG